MKKEHKRHEKPILAYCKACGDKSASARSKERGLFNGETGKLSLVRRMES